jgi:DNA polymerase-4
MPAERAILHVDMDAFYAAVEQRDRVELRGKPVVVGSLGPRSVVSTCSYEARPFGVRSAMPTLTAQRLCPDAIFVAPRMARYQEVSREVFAVFAEVTPEIEGLSLDEAFLDVTRSLRLFGGDMELIGQRIKQGIRQRTGLNASVGMAHNKLLAKLASELSKPDGFLHIRPEHMQATLDPLPVSRLWTVGKVAEAALHQLGLRTVGELRRADPARLVKALGNHAAFLLRLARGEDDRVVQADSEDRSISAETTFDIDLDTLEQAEAWLARLAERVGERVRGQGLKGATVTVKLRKPPFETHTRQQRLPARSDATEEITAVARTLLHTWWSGEKRPRLRLLGVGLSGFGEDSQDDLFSDAEARQRDVLADAVNRRYGHGALTRAAVLRTRRREEP